MFLIFISFIPANSKVFFLEADYYQDKTQTRKIIIGKGEIISSDKEISRVAVSDPSIADLQVLNEKQIFARGKQLGISTFLIWEKGKTVPSRFDIAIWPDIDALTKQLQELDKNITVDYIPPNTGSIAENNQGQQQSSTGTQENESSGSSSLPGGSSSQSGQGGSSSSSSSAITGKIILKGKVANAEIIARALQIAGSYVGDQGIKIISQPGGQIVDGLGGRYDIYSNSDSQSQSQQGSATAFGARDPIRFTSNRYANLSRSVIATTQKGNVISFLSVNNPPQVSVAIRFYEISRTLSRNLGFNTNFGGSVLQGGTFVGGNAISQATGAIGSIANLAEFMAGSGQQSPEFTFGRGSRSGSFLSQNLGQGVTGVIFNPENGIGIAIQALQQRGEIKTLAEPTLIIANGEPASFLAGGEVPILRSVFTAGGASQDVTFEPFGIKFNILPTVTSEDRIFLQLIPEIRDIDTDLSNLVAPPGGTSIRPPAFRTRRTQTQVELQSGQAFAISGLLREDNTRSLQKVPGIGDMPILGTLFRSKNFRKGQSELLIVVTPEIIRPTTPEKISQLSIPEVPYNEFDQLAPMKPYIKLNDEKGPDMKTPLDGGKYNEKINKSEEKIFNEDENLQLRSKKSVPIPSAKKRIFQEKSISNNDISEEVKLKKEQQMLQEKWQLELTKYTQAKEAMRLARGNKSN
ncbi:MAG: hypothetical protein A3B68_08210 [Candidatus Melainabacteria bacterium RIFCSPHIGHO2_02_FULL_34_12]|nr:MAG: hypothetical protein A3B68_08210 [Candidatus Melainabacteria bacterium RIFCSPHIGHO2_02_FULL_34_12]